MKRCELKERNEKILDLLKTNSQKDVAKMFGLSQGAIYLITKKNGVKHKKSRLNLSKLGLDVCFFENIDTPKKAYWLGFICADGSINKTGGKLTIFTKDLEILKKIKKDILSEHRISDRTYYDKRTKKTYEEYSIQVTNEIFVSNIIKHGVTAKKSDVLNFPETLPEKLYPYFIAGLFDGDGSVSYETGKKSLRCSLISTREVLDFINDFFYNKFGWVPCKKQKVTENKNNVYKAFWYKHAIDFLDYIYGGEEEIYLTRKYSIYKNFKNEKD